MKKLIIFAISLLSMITSCNGQNHNNQQLQNNNNQQLQNNKTMKTFNINKYIEMLKDYDCFSAFEYKNEMGMIIRPSARYIINSYDIEGYREDCYYPNSPYKDIYFYDKRGNMTLEYTTFYDFQIGHEIQYDSVGNIINDIDKDKPYKFGIKALIEKMQKDYNVNLLDMKSVRRVNRWIPNAIKQPVYEVVLYGKTKLEKIFYYIDGTTGKTLYNTKRVFSHEGMKGQELPFDEYLRSIGIKNKRNRKHWEQ